MENNEAIVKLTASQHREMLERLDRLSREKADLEIFSELSIRLSRSIGLSEAVESILTSIMNLIGGINVTLYYRVFDKWHLADVYGRREENDYLEDPLVKSAIDRNAFSEESYSIQEAFRSDYYSDGKVWVFPFSTDRRPFGAVKIEGILVHSKAIRDQLEIFIDYAAHILKAKTEDYGELKNAYDKLSESQERILHLDNLIRVSRSINRLLVHERNIDSLLNEAVRILVETPAVSGAWIALFDVESKLEGFYVSRTGEYGIDLEKSLRELRFPDCIHTLLEEKEETGRVRVLDCSGCLLVDPGENMINLGSRINYNRGNGGVMILTLPLELAEDEEFIRTCEEVSDDLSTALSLIATEERLEKSYADLKRLTKSTIKTISTIVEMRDPYTSGHQERVAILAGKLAESVGLSEERVEIVKIGSLLHDIGKISIPAEILNKPGTITSIEMELIRQHPTFGYQILEDVDFPEIIKKIVLDHHERQNGSGYPSGLVGDEIPLEARIVAVADVVEAMSSHRPYRPSLGIEVTLDEIRKNKGILYDETVADCLLSFEGQIENILESSRSIQP